jgi:hypothetical protein
MPKGPRDEKRAAAVMRIATGEETEELSPETRNAAAELGSRGGKARAKKLTPERRGTIAKMAARTRWEKSRAARGKKVPV